MLRRALWAFGVFLLLAYTWSSTSCATIGSPGGGGKDTLAPSVIQCDPPNLSVALNESGERLLSFDGKRVLLEFDEYYVLKNPSTQIYLSPPTDGELEFKQKGKKLYVQLPDSLKAATTYTLNFGSSLTDLTEGNVQNRFKYVFSTGTFIDSFHVQGIVVDAYTQKAKKNMTVALYEFPDSMTEQSFDSIPLQTKPSFIGITDEEGFFSVDFVRSGMYKLLSFDDKNSDLVYNPGSEAFAFSKESVVSDSLPRVFLRSSVEEQTPELRKPSHVDWGKIQVPFSAPVRELQWFPPLEGDTAMKEFAVRINPAADTMSFFWDSHSLDSLRIPITWNDTISDTALIRMRNYDAPERMVFQLNVNPQLDPTDSLQLIAARPFRIIEPGITLRSRKDSTEHTVQGATAFKFSHPLGIGYTEPGTSELEILPGQLEILGGVLNPDTLILSWKMWKPQDYAELLIEAQVEGDFPMIFELMKKGKVIRRLPFKGHLSERMIHLPPGEYRLQILEDLDSNDRWTPADWEARRQAEKMFYYDEPVTLKANWEVECVWRVQKEEFVFPVVSPEEEPSPEE